MSLRNRSAAAEWLRGRRAEEPGVRVAIVAAGERRPDGTLRPAVEDLWGAGALVAALDDWPASPEARAAAAAFTAVADDVRAALHDCASGRELHGMGFPDDVDTAAELDESTSVPILRDGAFIASRSNRALGGGCRDGGGAP
ncbi:2-phosphosulfolactate phosphatase [Pseudonocardia xishanensis]|uniref:Probable 2-phosphosulfolactate phosphatase n=1 Tax=Pseudonocardia xishanensis TaxID=630995 RepID=A0ABP8RWT6_9PSEU